MKNNCRKCSDRFCLFKYFVLFFIVIQPLLDFYFLFSSGKNTLFSFSISTVVRFSLVAFFGSILIFLKKLDLKKLLLFITLFATYVLLHHFTNAQSLQSIGAYSSVKEIFYLLRLLIPFVMIAVVFDLKFSPHSFSRISLTLTTFISGTIVLTNLLGFSLGSYTHQITNTRITDWLSDVSFYEAATKGFFMYANQTSAVLLFLLSFNLFFYIRNKSRAHFLAITLSLIAMIMLGTRVSTLGFAAALVFFIISTLIINGRELSKRVLAPLCLLIVAWLVILPFSPMLMRHRTNLSIDETDQHKQRDVEQALKKLHDVESQSNKEEMIKFVEDNYKTMSIDPATINDLYSYKDDPEFWLDIFKRELSCRKDNRCIQIAIAQRLQGAHDNRNNASPSLSHVATFLFGNGYTRSDSLFPIERDFMSHFYNLGFTGFLLFILPLLFVLLTFMFAVFLSKTKKQKLESLTYFFSVIMLYLAAFAGGNVLDSVFVMIIASSFMGYGLSRTYLMLEFNLLYEVFPRIVGSQKKFNSLLDRAITSRESKLIVTLNPEIIEKGLSNKALREILLDYDNIILTPDGAGIVVAGKMLGFNIEGRITGVDVSSRLFDIANRNRLSVSVLGSSQDTICKLKTYIKQEYGFIKLKEAINGYGDRKADIAKIVKSKPDIILFALGSGVQETELYKIMPQLPHTVSIGVGGSLDVFAGNVRRAPDIFIKLNIEWLYRILKQPTRIKRFFFFNVKFMFRILVFCIIKLLPLKEIKQ